MKLRAIKIQIYIYIQHILADYLSLKYNCKVNFVDEVISPVLQSKDDKYKSDKYGAYSEEFKSAIVYISSIHDLKTLVMSCFHEYRHGVQHQELLSNEEYHFWTCLAAIKDPTGVCYKANPLEIDAFVFAATLGKKTSLSEVLTHISTEEVLSLLKKNKINLLKRKLYFSTSEYHQIAESVPSWKDICILFYDLFLHKMR